MLDISQGRDVIHGQRQHLKGIHLADYGDVIKVISPEVKVLYAVDPISLGLHVNEFNCQCLTHLDYIILSQQSNLLNITGVLGFWGFGVLGLGFRV